MKKILFKQMLSLILIVSMTTPLITEDVSAGTLFTGVPNAGSNSVNAMQAENYSEQANGDVKREKVIEKTKDSTTYQRTDGSKEVVMYSSDVRYRNDQNKLIDYDPSLVEITDETKEKNNLEGYQYENKQGDTKQYIPTNLTEETPILLQYDDYQVTLRPVFSNENIEAASLEEKKDYETNKLISNITIEEALSNVNQGLLPEENELDEAVLTSEKTVDIYDKVQTRPTKTTYSTTDKAISFEYISQETGIKENIILNKKPDTNIFLYELTVKNAYPRENGTDGGITFYDKVSNDIIGNIPAPFMNDASKNAYSENLSFSIGLKEGTDDTYILALTVDTEYLNSADRQYPVIIDPSYVWTGGTDVADAYVLNGTTYGDTNFYSSAVTTFSVGDGAQGLYRTYIRFADFLTKLSGYYVDSAKLTLYETGSSQANNTIQVHRVTEDWSKTTVTWNNRPAYSTTPITSVVTSGTAGKAKTLDITSYARQVANGTYSSYGIMLRANDESSSGLYSQFYSSRYSNEALRPKLAVIYYDGPTTASSVTLKSAYIKPGATATINWSDINSQSLNMVQYHIYKYNDETATLGDEIISYSSSTKIGTTSSGSSTIPATASLSEGCYRIYVRGVDSGGIKGAGKGVTLHIDGTAPTISTAKLSPATSGSNYSNKIPSLTWSGGADSHFSQVEYSVNSSAYAKAGSTSGTITLPASSFSAAGVYTVKIRAVDKSGNYSVVKTLSYYYDKNVSDSNKPEITKIQFANTTNASPDITITSGRPDGAGFTVSKVYYYMVASTSTTEPTDDQYLLATDISKNEDKTNFKLNSTDTSKGNGVYKLYVKIQDTNNNTSEAFLAAYYRMVNVVYDTSVTLSAAYNETDNVIALSWNGDSSISSVKLYKRFGEDSFKYGQTINTGTSVNVSTEDIEDTADFRLLVTYLNGSQKASNIVSILNESQEDEVSGAQILKYTVTTFDTDSDTLEDGYEIWQYNTDYLDDDTDDDGITDGYELKTLISNPLIKDSDKDGFDDGYEVKTLGTNPTVLTVNEDSDGDGIDNLTEYKNQTNPYLKDSDFDGLIDNGDIEPLKTSTTTNITPDYNVEINKGIYDIIEENPTNEPNVIRKTMYNSYNHQIKEISDYTANKLLNKTYYFYNNEGNITAVIIYADGKYSLNTYYYKDNLLLYIYHNGFGYDFEYNSDQLLSCIKIGDLNLISYHYDNNGNITSKAFANGQNQSYEYDDKGIINKVYNDSKLDYDITNTQDGNISKLIDNVNGVTYSYEYNENHELTRISADNGFKITYSQENAVDNGNITSSSLSTTYNDNLVQKSTQGNITINKGLQEGDISSVSTTLLISGARLETASNIDGDTSASTKELFNSNNNKILSQSIFANQEYAQIDNQAGDKLYYKYDRNNNIVSILANNDEINSYTYDEKQQLIRENNKLANKTIVYNYDSGGNISKTTEYVYTKGDLINPLSKNEYEYRNNQWKDLLTSFNGQTITYDLSGNPLIYRDGINLTWSNGRNLDSYMSEEYNVKYKYNYNGLRTEKIIYNKGNQNSEVINYYYDDNKLIQEKSGNETIWYLYDVENNLVGFELNGISYYYERNIQGDIIKIYNSTGEEVVTYSYDSWGNIVSISGDEALGIKNPYRYRGYYYDNETRWYYVASRYYDPEICRFINADDPSYLGASGTLLSYNLFAYGENNPVNMVDYDGHAVINVICAAIGGIAGWYFGDYVAKKLGYSSGWKYWSIRGGVVVGGSVIGWFAGTMITNIISGYLRNNPAMVFKIIKKFGPSGFATAMNLLGINPFSLAVDSSKFIALTRFFNSPSVTIGLEWAKSLYYKAVSLGYKVMLDVPHNGWSWHMHISGSNGKLSNLHIQISKSAYDFLKTIIK